jgi:hypothetical protein
MIIHHPHANNTILHINEHNLLTNNLAFSSLVLSYIFFLILSIYNSDKIVLLYTTITSFLIALLLILQS